MPMPPVESCAGLADITGCDLSRRLALVTDAGRAATGACGNVTVGLMQAH